MFAYAATSLPAGPLTIRPLPIRTDIVDVHRRTWRTLAAPGSWWSGSERIAIGHEVRAALGCSFCDRRRRALSPYSVTGAHDSVTDLPDAAVDAVHRIVTDVTRLTSSFLQSLRDVGITDGHYVELLGCAMCVLDIDEFHRSLGLALEPFPEPEPGDEDRYRPPGLRDDLYWFPALDPRRAGPAETDLFPGKRTGNVLRSLSLVPDAMRMACDLSAVRYVATQHVPDLDHDPGRAISRRQMELIASRVSELNDCVY